MMAYCLGMQVSRTVKTWPMLLELHACRVKSDQKGVTTGRCVLQCIILAQSPFSAPHTLPRSSNTFPPFPSPSQLPRAPSAFGSPVRIYSVTPLLPRSPRPPISPTHMDPGLPLHQVAIRVHSRVVGNLEAVRWGPARVDAVLHGCTHMHDGMPAESKRLSHLIRLDGYVRPEHLRQIPAIM